MPLSTDLLKAWRIASQEGWRALAVRIPWILERKRQARRYMSWLRQHAMTPERRDAIRTAIAQFSSRPLISVIVPVYNVDERWLRACIGSVTGQLYDHWELCIADDKSPNPRIREVLEELAAQDSRIKTVYRSENGHISAASNSALALANGDFCVLLDHDDELAEDALFHVAGAILGNPETAFIYSDDDIMDEDGSRLRPQFKPDFSRDLFYSLNYVTHLSAYRTEILRRIGGFREGVEGSQDYDLTLRVLEVIDERQIVHIPRILYHWRAVQGSVALDADAKPYAYERAREAIRRHLARTGKSATVSVTPPNFNRVTYAVPEPRPLIRIVRFGEPSGGAQIEAVTDYGNVEIVSVIGRSAAALNAAVHGQDAPLFCFLDADLVPLDRGWLRELAGFAMQSEIGVVGARSVSASGMVNGGGFVLGGPAVVRLAQGRTPREAPGSLGRNMLISNYSAVSISCLMIRRELFEQVGGFDEANFPTSLFDADLCLRVRASDLRVVVTPFAELRGTLRGVRPSRGELERFRGRWAETVARDPFYNPNLALTGQPFAIASD